MTQPNDRTVPGGWTPDDGATVHLGRPHDPAPDEPTAYLSGDPTAHLGADATARWSGGDESTVHLDATVPGEEPTTRFGGYETTIHLGANADTTRLGPAPAQRAPGEPTVHLRTPEPVDERTVHLGGSASFAEPTTAAPGIQPTTWDPTATASAGPAAATEAGTVAGERTGGPTSRGGAFGARTSGGTAPGGEVRFGPGVPATPPPAPAWPAAAPPPRRRPLWRRLTSVLSTLLTVVLVAVVGLYLWQRLSPLEISGVTVAVPEPAGDRCDVTVDVVATVTTNGRAGEIRYQWLRSGSAPGAVLTERVGHGQPTAQLTLRWAFSGVGSTAETATVNITAPSPAQARTVVTYDCRR